MLTRDLLAVANLLVHTPCLGYTACICKLWRSYDYVMYCGELVSATTSRYSLYTLVLQDTWTCPGGWHVERRVIWPNLPHASNRFSVQKETRYLRSCVPPPGRGVRRISFREELEHMASTEVWAYNGGLGRSPQRDPGAEPLVGVRGQSPLETESFLLWAVQRK